MSVALRANRTCHRGTRFREYFDTLGVHAAIGRLFSPSDTVAAGGNPVVALGNGYWKKISAVILEF